MDTFLLIHILISLAGIATGFIVLGGWISGRHLRGWTPAFLISTTLVSVTGLLLPLNGLTPAVVLAILSLLILAVAIYALTVGRRAGRWETVYTIAALAALYLNFFVLVAQLFQKTPALKALAPTQSEPPFAISQALVLALFIVLGVSAVKRLKAARVAVA